MICGDNKQSWNIRLDLPQSHSAGQKAIGPARCSMTSALTLHYLRQACNRFRHPSQAWERCTCTAESRWPHVRQPDLRDSPMASDGFIAPRPVDPAGLRSLKRAQGSNIHGLPAEEVYHEAGISGGLQGNHMRFSRQFSCFVLSRHWAITNSPGPYFQA